MSKPEKLFSNGPEWVEYKFTDDSWSCVIAGVEYEIDRDSDGTWWAECCGDGSDGSTEPEALDWLRDRVREHAAEIVGVVGTEWIPRESCHRKIKPLWRSISFVEPERILTIAGQPIRLPEES